MTHRSEPDREAVPQVEEALSSALRIVHLKREAASVEPYKNFVVLDVNNHCVRMSVMKGEFPWHHHPHSDECFLVLEGELEIDLRGGQTFRLKAGDAFTIPKGVSHRTRSQARAVNLCFEDRNAYTEVVLED